MDDLTRPTPTAEILKILLSQLSDSRLSRNQITIVMAIGTHEVMEREALETKLGKGVATTYKVVQHNAWQSDLVPIRIPGDEKVVKINPEVAQADLKVGISSILPHPMAGYGGGPKILMPGVCNFEYIRDHHTTHVIHPRSIAGVTNGNPFHEGCMKTARAIGLDFSINCVYNQKGQVIRIIGGNLEKAFAQAVEVCSEKLGHKFEEKVDVTITSTYPHTHGHQLFKGLSAPDIVTKNRGAILLVAPVIGPIVAEFLNSITEVRQKSNNNPAAYIKEACPRRSCKSLCKENKMKKQFRIICLLTYFMIVPFVSTTLAQEESVREKATIFINYYNSKDFLGATSLFHFPADYTANELREDKDDISKTLKMYYEEFGRIESIEEKDFLSLYYSVSIGGGNLPYWQKYPNTYNLFNKVKFSREGQGYVVLVFCNISGKWEIRQVNYGLPADRPKSQERILEIFEKWMKLRGQ